MVADESDSKTRSNNDEGLETAVLEKHVDFLVEKRRLDGLPLDEKRKSYVSADFVKVEDIPVWQEGLEVEPPRSIYDVHTDINGVFCFWEGNPLRLEVECVVNPDTRRDIAEGALDQDIFQEAGEWLFKECELVLSDQDKIGLTGCQTGNAQLFPQS